MKFINKDEIPLTKLGLVKPSSATSRLILHLDLLIQQLPLYTPYSVSRFGNLEKIYFFEPLLL